MRHPVIPTTLFRTCTGCGAKVAARTPTTNCPTRDRVIADATRAVEAGHLPSLSADEWVRRTADRFGMVLAPWQEEILAAMRRGERIELRAPTRTERKPAFLAHLGAQEPTDV